MRSVFLLSCVYAIIAVAVLILFMSKNPPAAVRGPNLLIVSVVLIGVIALMSLAGAFLEN